VESNHHIYQATHSLTIISFSQSKPNETITVDFGKPPPKKQQAELPSWAREKARVVKKATVQRPKTVEKAVEKPKVAEKQKSVEKRADPTERNVKRAPPKATVTTGKQKKKEEAEPEPEPEEEEQPAEEQEKPPFESPAYEKDLV
jgi:hypothetical protein